MARVGHSGHVPLRDVCVKRCLIFEQVTHVGNLGHVPLPDRAVRTLGAIAVFRYFDACVDGVLEFFFGFRLEH